MASRASVNTLAIFALEKCLLGLHPKPAGSLWTPCPEASLSAAPSLTLLGLTLPPAGQVEEMIDVGLDRHRLPHFLLRRPVLSVEFFLPLRQLPALLFQRVHPGELGPVQNVMDRRLCRPIGGQGASSCSARYFLLYRAAL